MAHRLPDGSIQMADGRIIYGNSLINAQDLIEILPLITPPPAWPFISGGGGGGAGTPGARGADGVSGSQGPQGPGIGNPGPQGSQGNQGSLGTQGNQGTIGSGVQGPQGRQGAQGLLGPQGDAGLNGSQGFQGRQGNQGFQGNTGIGTQGQQGPQATLANDIFAADRVVDPGGAGTDTTLAAAIAALPANGGTIYVKAGTYAIAATMTLPVKNITIIGAGGNGIGGFVDPSATVFDLGANAIFLFTTGTVGSGFGSYTFRGFEVVGTSQAGQGFLEVPPAALGSNILCEELNIQSVQDIIKTNGQDAEVTFRDCSLTPTTATASLWHGAGPGGELNWDHVKASLPVSGTANAITGGPSWNVAYSYVGGGGGPSTFQLKDINWVAFFLGKLNDKATVTVTSAISTIVSCQFIGVSLIINTTLFFCSNSWFSGSSTGANQQLTLNGVAATGDMTITGVNFDASGAASTIGIDIVGVSNIEISGCQFEGHGTAGIRASGVSTLSATGCRFSETVPVLETAATVTGKYASNDGFTNSVIVGTTSTVDGHHVRTVAGNTTLTINDETVLVNAAGGPVTITLPVVTTVPFTKYNIKKIDATANAVTIQGTGGQLIDGAATQSITTQYVSLSPESDNVSAWWIV